MNNSNSDKFNIICILFTFLIVQMIMFSNVTINREIVSHTTIAYYKDESDIKMIDGYLNQYINKLDNPSIMSVYSFVYNAKENNKGIPLVVAFEPKYTWHIDESMHIDMEKYDVMYNINNSGEEFSKLLRGETIIIDPKLNKDLMLNNSIEQVAIVPIIMNYKLKGFIMLAWEKKEVNQIYIDNARFFGDLIRPYVRHKEIIQTGSINSNTITTHKDI